MVCAHDRERQRERKNERDNERDNERENEREISITLMTVAAASQVIIATSVSASVATMVQSASNGSQRQTSP
jgi:hypothetical protein